eukprot:scaffold32890_cov40-Attheya_sp.AAC.1
MVLWGGLRPIPSRLLLDVTTLGLLGYCAVIEPDSRAYAGGLTLAYTKTLATAGWTTRWSLTIPMTPFLFLQVLRQLTFVEEHYWIRGTIFVLSFVCLFLAAALCILFPAVELRPIRDGTYNVGVVDLQLPVVFALDLLNKCNPEVVGKEETNGFVSVRILYPTRDAPGSVPYLDPKLAKLFCAQLMKLGAPPTLKGFGWILHTWCLHNLPIRRNATPIDDETMPLVIFSHGLMGNASIYSHQGMSLASKGSCVLMINHSDGSSPIVEQQDGSIMYYNEEIIQSLLLCISERSVQAILLVVVATEVDSCDARAMRRAYGAVWRVGLRDCLRLFNARRSKMQLFKDKTEEVYKGKQNMDSSEAHMYFKGCTVS